MSRENKKPILLFEKLWTVEELSEYLKVSVKTIYDWVHKKTIPFQKINRLLRFRPSEIEKWLSHQKENNHGNRFN